MMRALNILADVFFIFYWFAVFVLYVFAHHNFSRVTIAAGFINSAICWILFLFRDFLDEG